MNQLEFAAAQAVRAWADCDEPVPFENEMSALARACDIEGVRQSGDTRAISRVAAEIARAREHHAPINSAHEGYAVILEELEEFWREVQRKRAERDPAAMLEELVQCATMCLRTAVDIGLLNEE